MFIHTIYDDVAVGTISPAPTYAIVFYENILFDICPLSQGQNQSINFLHIMQTGAMNSHTRN